MISAKMTKAMNAQINKELFSAYLYMAMASSAEAAVRKGTAKWFTIQVQEEVGHAMRFYKYMQEQGATVELEAIAKPQGEYRSLLDMFELTLKHEKTISKSLRDLLALAQAEKDPATAIFLQWFITEQVEEEANATEIIAQIKMVGNSGGGLFMIDKGLGHREASK